MKPDPVKLRIAFALHLNYYKIHQISQYPKSWGGNPNRLDRPVNKLTAIPPDRSIGADTDCYRTGWVEGSPIDFGQAPDTNSYEGIHTVLRHELYGNEDLARKFVRELFAELERCYEGLEYAPQDIEIVAWYLIDAKPIELATALANTLELQIN